MHMQMKKTFMPFITCTLLVFTISGCQKEQTATAPPPPDVAITATQSASAKAEPAALAAGQKAPVTPNTAQTQSAPALNLGEFKIIRVDLGTSVDEDNSVISPKAAFKARDKIYASVLSTGKHAGLKLQARWTSPDGKLVAKTEHAIVPTAAMVSTFSIDHDKAWPAGTYMLEISLNDQVQKSTSFEIR
jgi:hypothetical protein